MRISLALLRRSLLPGILLVLLAGPSAVAASAFQPPVHPLTVSRPFDRPPTPYAAGHRGVDLEGSPGEAVRAAGTGQVSYAGLLAGRGVVVVVHGALRTTYEPVHALVRRGMQVSAGAEIGTLQAGHAGCPVVACLHWGLLRGDTYLDPLSLLGDQRVRLLPPAGDPQVNPAALLASAPMSTPSPAAFPSPALNPGVTWSVAGLAGAGVVMLKRRR